MARTPDANGSVMAKDAPAEATSERRRTPWPRFPAARRTDTPGRARGGRLPHRALPHRLRRPGPPVPAAATAGSSSTVTPATSPRARSSPSPPLAWDPTSGTGRSSSSALPASPGDRDPVSVPETVRINGAKVGEGLALAGTLKRPPEDFLRDDNVPPGHLWVMGATADSFDSRYWGFLPETAGHRTGLCALVGQGAWSLVH